MMVFMVHVFCFTAFRAQQGEVVRIACRIVPLEAFQIAAEWLQYQIASPIDTGDTTCKCSSSILAHSHSKNRSVDGLFEMCFRIVLYKARVPIDLT